MKVNLPPDLKISSVHQSAKNWLYFTAMTDISDKTIWPKVCGHPNTKPMLVKHFWEGFLETLLQGYSHPVNSRYLFCFFTASFSSLVVCLSLPEASWDIKMAVETCKLFPNTEHQHYYSKYEWIWYVYGKYSSCRILITCSLSSCLLYSSQGKHLVKISSVIGYSVLRSAKFHCIMCAIGVYYFWDLNGSEPANCTRDQVQSWLDLRPVEDAWGVTQELLSHYVRTLFWFGLPVFVV